MKHLFTDGDNYCEGDLHDTDPFSELLAELMQPPAANTGQATPAAEGLDKYEFSFITKVILRLLIPLGEPTLLLFCCTCSSPRFAQE